VSIQPAPAQDFWPLESRHCHFPNPNPNTNSNPNLQNTLQKNRPGGNFHSFTLHGKGKNAKNNTNTDSNPTTNPNPKPTIQAPGKTTYRTTTK